MAECHSTATLIDARAELPVADGAPVADPTEYWSHDGALMLTCLDMAYAAQQVSIYA